MKLRLVIVMVLCFTIVILAWLLLTASAGDIVRIMPLGDSITQGAVGYDSYWLAEPMTTTDSLVQVVDYFYDFDPSEDTYDGIHPNESGIEKMARRWYDAFDLLLVPFTSPI